jgi:alkanesulfonate monooxygenase SsuD/methylene tetrahydromethanopterin reductase-like flavin-dependent oxidoreductase (luciferase family)
VSAAHSDAPATPRVGFFFWPWDAGYTTRMVECVTNLVTRHPSITATAAASVDAMSNGRFHLGIGTGHSAVVNVGERPSSPESFRAGLDVVRRQLASLPRPVPTRRGAIYFSDGACTGLARAGWPHRARRAIPVFPPR